MRKSIILMTGLMILALLITGCVAGAEQRMGEAEGYGGVLRVAVSMNGGDVTAVEVVSHSETEGVGTRAIDVLPDMIVREDSVDVDSVAGATITSQAIKAAVAQAIGQDMPAATQPAAQGEQAALRGMGMAATGRLGPGTAEDGTPVYSFNVVFASAAFDADGRILTLDVDQLEVLSSQFTGFPEEKEAGQDFLTQVSQWTTKGAQGDGYMLGSGSWRQQMDAYEQMMTGMTIEEINAWYSANFSTETGKPVDNADAVTGATMSLRDEHGDILTAIQRAWEDAQRQQGTPTDMTSPTEDGLLNDTNTETLPTEGGASYG
ncbi:MAG: FMN-binding protein [Clostridia bacterium]|nr:FMN-binding protein [Clostridia bacterium]